MSSALKHFCTVVARTNGAGEWPRKYGMNWFIPAFVSSRPDSGSGISEDDGTRLWPRSSKKRRNDSRISSPRMASEVAERGARLALNLIHRPPALGDRLGDQSRELEEPAARFARERGRRDLPHLSPREPCGEDRPGGAGAEPEREPEDAPHSTGGVVGGVGDEVEDDEELGPRRNLDAAVRSPAPRPTILTRGLVTACSTSVEIFSTRPTMLFALSSMPSTRSISRLVFTTEFRTSVRSGTVSWRMPSIRSFVDVRTLYVLSRTMHRNSTSAAHAAARMMSAQSPAVIARTAMRKAPCRGRQMCAHHTGASDPAASGGSRSAPDSSPWSDGS